MSEQEQEEQEKKEQEKKERKDRLEVCPLTLREANDFVASFHRHHGPTAWGRGKFAIGALYGDQLVGIAIVGLPLASALMDGWTAEVQRTCVRPDAPRNTNSFLYAACWRVWRAMGGKRLVTYTLASESGASLRGAGWKVVAEVPPHDGWERRSMRDGIRRKWQPVYGQLKFRWEIVEKRA